MALWVISIHTLTKRVTKLDAEKHIVIDISIHTLTKRVTFPWKVTINKSKISIHTLTKRVTLVVLPEIARLFNFNPHSHKESDYLSNL